MESKKYFCNFNRCHHSLLKDWLWPEYWNSWKIIKIQQVYTEHLFCARHCSRHWRFSSDQNPCPCGTYSQMGLKKSTGQTSKYRTCEVVTILRRRIKEWKQAYTVTERANFQIKSSRKASLREWVLSKALKEIKPLVMNLEEEMLIWYSRIPTKASRHEVSQGAQ